MHLPPIFMGTLREHYILLFTMAGTVALGAGFIGSWVGAWLSSRRTMRAIQELSLQKGSGLDAAQLATMMQALDAISLEVERISEAQRFTARVLAERQPAQLPALRGESRSITPH